MSQTNNPTLAEVLKAASQQLRQANEVVQVNRAAMINREAQPSNALKSQQSVPATTKAAPNQSKKKPKEKYREKQEIKGAADAPKLPKQTQVVTITEVKEQSTLLPENTYTKLQEGLIMAELLARPVCKRRRMGGRRPI